MNYDWASFEKLNDPKVPELPKLHPHFPCVSFDEQDFLLKELSNCKATVCVTDYCRKGIYFENRFQIRARCIFCLSDFCNVCKKKYHGNTPCAKDGLTPLEHYKHQDAFDRLLEAEVDKLVKESDGYSEKDAWEDFEKLAADTPRRFEKNWELMLAKKAAVEKEEDSLEKHEEMEKSQAPVDISQLAMKKARQILMFRALHEK
ncbi:unnamed protein product [Caenorhabditis auriculariae]|uniref:IBR domain-containing protein n=1 Tax=Caenorhabditis auriculariae TaxID=2777116 RepID=A0A8S1GZJ8_9PELO|nr:unnamed protein product [Caenorhabditis auriculariae]